MSNMKSGLQIAVVSALLAIGVMALPAAKASLRLNSTAGSICKAASGPGAAVFYFSNLYAENTSTATQYLTCAFPDMNESGEAPTALEISFQNTTAAAVSYTCVIQSGWLQNGYVVNSATFTKNPGANSELNVFATSGTTPAMPARGSGFSPYSVSCSVPPGGRFGLVTTLVTGTKV